MLIFFKGPSGTAPSAKPIGLLLVLTRLDEGPISNGSSIGLLLALTWTNEVVAIEEGPSPEVRYVTGQAYKPQLIGQAKFPERHLA